MRWLSRISPADVLTLCNGLLGTLAVTYILDGRHVVATLLIFSAVLVDGLDGMAARRFKSPHEFGRFLDSISDAVSFCLAPGLLLYNNFYDKALGSAWVSMPNAVAVAGCVFFVGFGLLRLARFAGRDFDKSGFVGLPTPAAALIALVLCMLWGKPELNPFFLGYEPYWITGSVVVLGFVMISDVPYPKIRGRIALAVGLTVALGIFTMGLWVLESGLDLPFTEIFLLILVLLLSYFFIGPIYETSAQPRKARPRKKKGQKA